MKINIRMLEQAARAGILLFALGAFPNCSLLLNSDDLTQCDNNSDCSNNSARPHCDLKSGSCANESVDVDSSGGSGAGSSAESAGSGGSLVDPNVSSGGSSASSAGSAPTSGGAGALAGAAGATEGGSAQGGGSSGGAAQGSGGAGATQGSAGNSGCSSASAIASLVVHDDNLERANLWNVEVDFRVGYGAAHPWGDWPNTHLVSIDDGAKFLLGNEWISTAADSKRYAGDPLATLTLSCSRDIYILVDERWGVAPTWTAEWTDTGWKVVAWESSGRPSLPFRIFKKARQSGTVNLPGINGTTAYGYTIIVD